MTTDFANYFLLPLAIGTVGVLVTAWLYVLNDYGTWQLFLRHKTRARIVYSTTFALIGWAILCVIAQQLAPYATTASGIPPMPLPVRVMLTAVIAAMFAPTLYFLADGSVQKHGKIGTRRTGIQEQGVGIYAQYHAGWGGEHHI